MLEILQFIFSDFRIWLGTVILIGTIAEGIGGFIRINILGGGKNAGGR
jgi:hypothetical protein